ncbi:hypothetical protein PUR23_28945 [Methylorubrum populi]|uniref:hypothetical protein n=1 Tax=Methylorubrum populi TaxID=223967 RepID=UPI0031F79E0B
MTAALPMPLRSATALGTVAASALPLTPAGTTYTMAQEAAFVDERHYAVGRWDGTLSLFAFTDSPSQGPLVAKAVNSPAQEGIQAIVPLGPGVFMSSNDEGSLLIWSSATGDWSDLAVAATLAYDASLGVANSGATVVSHGAPCLAVGHAGGFVSLWRQGDEITRWTLAQTVDVRAPKPVNPWNLHNVRGVAAVPLGDGAGTVVTGSEDGNLTIVRVADGAILSATPYNPAAQRGINSLAVLDDLLLVVNCAVGAADANLWCYRIASRDWSVTLTDKAILRIDPNRPQVFNFDVVFAAREGGPTWFLCSTEEGALWMGRAEADGKLVVGGYERIGTAALGSALCASGERIAATAYDLHEFLLG